MAESCCNHRWCAIVGPDGEVVRPFKKKLIHKLDVPKSVLTTMRKAARTVVTIRHTYNLVDMPIRIAGKSGTAEFGIRDSKGRLPYSQWFVGFVPKDPKKGSFTKPTSELMRLAFAYDSRTVGNVATEIVKYYYMLHYGIKKDYRNHGLLERATSTRATDAAADALQGRAAPMGVIRADSVRVTDWASRSAGSVWRVRPPARHVRRSAGRGRPRHGLHEQPRERPPLPPGGDHVLAWPDVGWDRDRDVPHRDRIRLQVAQDLRVAAVRLQIGLLLLTLAIGDGVSGAARWVKIGEFTFQFSELAKVLMIIVLANYLGARQGRLDSLPAILGACLLVGRRWRSS